MIKKVFTFVIAGMMSVATLSAQKPALQWAALQDGPLTEIAVDIAPSQDGNVFILNNFYSKTEPENNVTYYDYWNIEDGTRTNEAVVKGSIDPDDGPNGVVSLSLFKIAPDGHLLWSVSSTLGDFSGGGNIAGTADGGVMLALKMRNTKAYEFNTLIRLVDKDGVETSVTWDNPSVDGEWIYQPVFVKISKEGKIEWTKKIDAGYQIEGVRKSPIEGFDFKDLVVDEEGNFYLGGNFSTSINFGEKANFTKARNVTSSWDGDTQGDAPKDFFIVKLNDKCEPIWGFQLDSDRLKTEDLVGLAYKPAVNGQPAKLFMQGYLKALNSNRTTVVKIGKDDIVPNENQSPIYGEINPETGEFNWAKILYINRNTKGSGAIKAMGLNYSKDAIFLYGSYQGDIYQGEEPLLTNEYKGKYNGYIIKTNITDGTVTGAVRIKNPTNANDITEIQGAYETKDGILATGYGLFSASNIYMFDKALTQESQETMIIKEAPMGVSTCSAIIGDNMLVNAMRGKMNVTLPEAQITTDFRSYGNAMFGCIYTGHKIADVITSVESIAQNNDEFNAYGIENAVVVETVKPCEVYVYNIMGSLVAAQSVQEGQTVITLDKGIYIINGVKAIVK